jgi:hypothetical protein
VLTNNLNGRGGPRFDPVKRGGSSIIYRGEKNTSSIITQYNRRVVFVEWNFFPIFLFSLFIAIDETFNPQCAAHAAAAAAAIVVAV